MTKKIQSIVKDRIPEEDETFADNFDLDEFPIYKIRNIQIYFAECCKCNNAKDYWVCEILFADDEICQLKLDGGIHHKDVLRFFKPLIDRVESHHNTNIH
jgi:hypothetical protein